MARRVLPAGLICAFRVHPEDGRPYYSVHVWESRRALRAYLATLETGHSLRQVIACCLWPARRRPVHIGEIHLNQQDLDQGTISHGLLTQSWNGRGGKVLTFTTRPTQPPQMMMRRDSVKPLEG